MVDRSGAARLRMRVHYVSGTARQVYPSSGREVNAAAEVAEVVLDGIEDGRNEVLVDALTRQMKAALAGPVEGLTVSVGR